MIFGLLNKKGYYSKIEEYVFDDIGMKTLFDDFYDHNWSDLQDIMSYIMPVEEIKKRQTIFNDAFNDTNNYLNTFKRLLDELRGSFRNYKSTDGGLRSYILYSQYIEKLTNFIIEGTKLLNNLDFESKELNNMKSFFNNLTNDKKFKELVDDNNKAISSYRNMQGFVVSYITGETFIHTYKLSEQELLDVKLKGILRELDIDTNDSLVNNIRHDLDPYYFNRLEYIYPDDYAVLKNFFDKYKDNINYDYDTLSDELNYYLKLKLLFLHGIDKKLFYTRVNIIEDDSDVVINDLCDYTIMNKVDSITPNEFELTQKNYMMIVTGANGGGKTTYLRSIGANYILFLASGFMFAHFAKVRPFKYIHSHFPNEENYQVGYGRLQDEIKRIDYVRRDFGKDCMYLLNETFSSTDEERAFEESKKLLNELEESHTTMIFITHQQLLIRYIDRDKIVLLNPVVDEGNDNKRTFKIRRVGDEIHAFANDILRKYGLSKDILQKKREQRRQEAIEIGSNKELEEEKDV